MCRPFRFLKIHHTLAEGLRSSFYLLAEDKPSHLWVDGICINQSDAEEKSQQVSLMSSIYSSAFQVLVWLGSEADFSNLALDAIVDLGDYFASDDNLEPFLHSKAAFEERNLPEYGGPVWQALRAFGKRPWFRRLWVVQEISLAKQAVIVCGNRSLAWKEFTKFSNAFTHSRLNRHIFPNYPHDHDDGFISASQFANYQIPQEFSILLLFATFKLSSEPVDHIYGLLGLAEEDARKEIKVDYELVNIRPSLGI
jgi:hypothetical protein